MVESRSWKEFKDAGMLWFINMILHVFGWAIVYYQDGDGDVMYALPARVKFRGFNEKNNTEGYIKLSKFMKENAETLLKESEE